MQASECSYDSTCRWKTYALPDNLSIGHVQFLCQFNCVAEVVLNGTLIITKLTEDTLFSTFKFANCSRNLMLDLSLEEPIRDYSVRGEFKKIA